MNDNEMKGMLEIIVGRFRPLRVLLFGSRARGVETAGSDYDLCVILPFLPRRKLLLLREMRTALWKYGKYDLDIIILSEQEFNEKVPLAPTIEYAIQKEGVVLYDQRRHSA
jgi:predicted nucleotidyltransferase